MKKVIGYLLSAVILLIIIVPRFYHLGSQPPGLHIDEVSFAADAKAIAETGRDTWNESWPLIFKAFGEWKAPGLVYSMAFWSKLLGVMNNTVARLPSAIAGLTILMMLGLTLRELMPKKNLALILFTIFVVAFSPWHFDMSRIFYEAFSALALFSVSLYFITKATVSPKPNFKLWVLAAIFASLSGYWYASIRYIVILSLGFSVLIQNWPAKLKIKKGLYLLVVVFFVGIGWVGDLVSDKGLNRLHYYQAKSKEGATLEIDEKRQYCYLSVNRDNEKVRPCYVIWNKPVLKITNFVKTYYTYLGSDYLFLESVSEFGVDSEYGAYLPPLLPIYVIGLFVVLKGCLALSNSKDRAYLIYAATALISLAPAAVANNVNMRMGLISLYIIAIIIGVGFQTITSWFGANFQKLTWIAYLAFVATISFYIVQSTMHYFLVFTRSNDLMWTSDAGSVFGQIKSVSKEYDRVVDSELHGPLAPYFYGDLTTSEVQNGNHSTPDAFGFTYLTQAGKYELRHVNVTDLACEKLSRSDTSKMLVITSPNPRLSALSKFSGRSWSGALLLREVYDVDDIIAYELRVNGSFKQNCTPK
jgi:hypothetical protein